MENNKNTIIALVLMLVVWIGFSLLHPPQPQTPPAVSSGQEHVASPGLTPSVKAPGEEMKVAPPVSPPVSTESNLAGAKVREITVETELYTARFTSDGARLKSLQLKKYSQTADPDSPPVFLTDVELGRLATLRTVGNGGVDLPPDAVYSISVDDKLVRVAKDRSRQVVFTTITASGLTVQKEFTFRGDSYDFDLNIHVINSASAVINGNMDLSLVQHWDESMETNRFEFVGPSTLVGEKVETEKVKSLAKESKTYGKEVVWSAFENKYFMTAAIPLDGSLESLKIEKKDDTVVNDLETPELSLSPGGTASFGYLLYFGPRDLEILKKVDHDLAEAIQFGFFGVIAKPLRTVLHFFYSFVGNYGVAIILLTVIIKALFWPLTQKSYSSMKAMQKLQPEMTKIREKFKNDREKLNREIMELYKKHRVNPLGGCLPMVVQIPVFFALYRVLLNDIALRHAPFAFWLTDLSAKDPYYVTPLIMGATMFLQQKMSPSTMDPKQAKMFMLMPVVFTFMFLNFPSGLVIYWLVNNLLTILQQYFINRKA